MAAWIAARAFSFLGAVFLIVKLNLQN